MRDGNLTTAEENYLKAISENGGSMQTRAIRDRISRHRSSFSGMSALGGVCRVLRRLEARGLVKLKTRDEYEITGDGLKLVAPVAAA